MGSSSPKDGNEKHDDDDDGDDGDDDGDSSMIKAGFFCLVFFHFCIHTLDTNEALNKYLLSEVVENTRIGCVTDGVRGRIKIVKDYGKVESSLQGGDREKRQ